MSKGVLLLLLLFPIALSAQPWSVRISGGFANYQGDLQEKRFTTEQAGIALGAGITYQLSNHFQIRGEFSYMKVRADDKHNTDPFLKARNLNFTSSVTEAHVGLEYSFLNMRTYRILPYVFGAVGVARFNPYTFDTTGAKYYLQALRTEGQGLTGSVSRAPYRRGGVVLPFGAGIRWKVSDKVMLGYEIGLRKTFTDYFDDVSTTYADPNLLLIEVGPKAVELAYRGGELKEGDPNYPPIGTVRGGEKYKDWYYNSVITVHVRLFSDRSSRFMSCPRPVL